MRSSRLRSSRLGIHWLPGGCRLKWNPPNPIARPPREMGEWSQTAFHARENPLTTPALFHPQTSFSHGSPSLRFDSGRWQRGTFLAVEPAKTSQTAARTFLGSHVDRGHSGPVGGACAPGKHPHPHQRRAGVRHAGAAREFSRGKHPVRTRKTRHGRRDRLGGGLDRLAFPGRHDACPARRSCDSGSSRISGDAPRGGFRRQPRRPAGDRRD